MATAATGPSPELAGRCEFLGDASIKVGERGIRLLLGNLAVGERFFDVRADRRRHFGSERRGILPLRDPRRLAVIGRAAQDPYIQGGGSSHVHPTEVSVPLDELRALLPPDAAIVHTPGYPEGPDFDQALIDEAVAAAEQSEGALLYIALPAYKESEGYDRPDLDLTEQQAALIQAVAAAQPRTVVILNNGSAVAMSSWIDGAAARTRS